MKRLIGWSVLIGLLVVLSLVDLASAQQPRTGGTLRIAWEQDVTGFDPHCSAGLQNIRDALCRVSARGESRALEAGR